MGFDGATRGSKRVIGVVAAAMALCATQPAGATVVVGEISGVVATGWDFAGVFGPPDSNLAGLSYTGRFTYDTAGGERLIFPHEKDRLVGDPAHGFPITLTYSLTINGITDGLLFSQSSIVELWTNRFHISGSNEENFAGTYVDEYFYDAVYNLDLDSPGFLPDAYDQWPTIRGFAVSEDIFGATRYSVGLNAQRIHFFPEADSPIGVPEPSIWMAMLVGFGLLGTALRRRDLGRGPARTPGRFRASTRLRSRAAT